jgi:hypothetical protein
MKLRDGCLERSRTDLHLTSTGKGHFYQRLHPFPPADFERSFHKAPPKGLIPDLGLNLRNEQFNTTTGSCHGEKTQDPVLRSVKYKKAPGHWNVNYMERTIDKLKAENNRSFTMGDRVSEMTSKYIKKENYRNSIENSLTKKNIEIGGATKTKFGSGNDRGLITQINPYTSLTNKDHRPFTSTDLARYPRKDALTFWEFESYPKVWGHGSNDGKNIPKRKTLDPTQGMADPTLGGIAIKSSIKKIPARPSAAHVPNKGLKSLVQASYIRHPGAPRLNLTKVNPPQPFQAYFNHGRGRNADSSNCPSMYTTEYQFHGGEETVRV